MLKVASKVLVPLDFSPTSRSALEYAVAIRRPKAEVVLVHVIDPLLFLVTSDAYGTTLDTGALLEKQRHFVRAQLEEIAASLRKRGVKTTSALASGPPAQTIAALAKKHKVDLIVMGTHGRSGISHLLLGSVAEKVVRSTSCAVLLVRGNAEQRRKRKAVKRR